MKNTADTRFYVYVYLDTRKLGEYIYFDDKIKLEIKFDYEPFYTGKGTGGRKNQHLTPSSLKSNSHKNNKIKKIIRETGDIPIVLTIEENLLEQDALNLEEKLVALIGRYNLNKGPLTNLTDAGECNSGAICSEEKKEKLRIINTGKTLSKETKKKISQSGIGRTPTEETRKKLIKSSTGKKLSQETKNKISTSNKGKSNITIYKITNPNGNIFYTTEGLRFFCEQNNLFHSNMLKVANREQKHHRGWNCERISPVNKIKSNKTNTKKHKLISPTGEIFFLNGLMDFCKEHNLQQSKISNVEQGIRPHHKGWKAEQINDFVAQ